MMMARNFEHGLYLVYRCQVDLPALANCLPVGSEHRLAVEGLIKAAQRVDQLFGGVPIAPAANQNLRVAR